MNDSEDVLSLRTRFTKYSRYGSKFGKAVDVVAAGSVKEHRFLPSGRTIYTVVGNLGDEFVNPQKPYCSCSHFYFRVLEGREDTCYHLLSYRIAFEAHRFDTIRFSDEEYRSVLRAIVSDVYGVIEKSAL